MSRHPRPIRPPSPPIKSNEGRGTIVYEKPFVPLRVVSEQTLDGVVHRLVAGEPRHD